MIEKKKANADAFWGEDHEEVQPIFGGEEAGQAPLDRASVVVLPVPMECTVSYGRGTGAGPAAILAASENMELFDELEWAPYWRAGEELHTLPPMATDEDPERAVENIARTVAPLFAAGKRVVSLGGEHTVTVGAVRGLVRSLMEDGGGRQAAPLGVLHFDAHADLRDQYEGTPYSHACVVRRMMDDMKLPVVSVGIRSLSQEEARYIDERAPEVVFAHEMGPGGAWIERVIAALPPKVYITVDLDGLDPAELPATGTPEPGGASYRQLVTLLQEVGRNRQVLGGDVVELAPMEGMPASDFTAARLVARLISVALSSRRQG